MVQVAEYLSEPLLGMKSDPYNYWQEKHNNRKCPLLCELVRKYLSAPCGSVESERVFSKAGLICTTLRNRIKAELVRKLLFLNANFS